MDKLKVLMTTVGGLTSPDIIKAIRENREREIELIGVDQFEFAIGRFFVDKFDTVPNSEENELEFINKIEHLVQKYNVDLIIPCGNEDNLALAKNKNAISTKIMVSDFKDLIRAYDKGEVYQTLSRELPEFAPNFYIVNTYSTFVKAIREIGYPEKKVVIKPTFGRGGRGVYILNGNLDYKSVFELKPTGEFPLEFFEKLLFNKEKFDDLIIMECLEAPFYSVYSLCKNGENLISMNHIREWGNASQTFRGLVYHDEYIEKFADKVIKLFNLSYTNNMELATNIDGRIVLFDLNPRIGASSGIDRHIGLNFPDLAINIALGIEVKIDKGRFKNKKRFIRYFDEVWISD